MAVTGTKFGALFHGEEGDTSNVLLLVPSLSAAGDDACMNLLTLTDISNENVLSVTFTQPAQDRLELWQTHVGDGLPAQAGIVTVGEQTESTGTQQTATLQPPGSVSIDVISDPTDLTGLGITLTNYL
ncbi:hypothetical protein ACFQGE_03990 [Halomicroarcula sp. GCM10025817]|uniref:DUF7504 family protein n=1 Tax=Haloarcula TaxID=2237 RepID=UPI0023E81DB4|nr:hypothetical protein [Halomicroarcula sp. SYNS111]